MKMNKKGFTLVELLAVIVILAIVMLVGVTAVGPVMEKARKNAIIDEGAAIIDGATLAYNADQIDSSTTIIPGECYNIDTLANSGYYTKKEANYVGAFKLTVTNGKIEVKYVLVNKGSGYGTMGKDGTVYKLKAVNATATTSDVDKDVTAAGTIFTPEKDFNKKLVWELLGCAQG